MDISRNETIQSSSLYNDLYGDLANALPSGIYRLRVFHVQGLDKERWLDVQNVPYAIEFANDHFFEILQLDRIEFEKNPGILHTLVLLDDMEGFAKLNVECNLNIVPFFWEGRMVVQGRVIWIRFKSIPRVLENGDIIWTGTLEDITSRKQFEEEMKLKNAELQRLNADKDYFMSILAHDLKTPFNSILGFLDILLSNIRTYDIEQIEKLLTIVQSSATNAHHLLEDLLGWSLSQSGKLPFEPRECHLKWCFDQVVDVLKPIADSKNITVHYAGNEYDMVYADVNMLNTILRNLISNAIKFTSEGGNITIRSEQQPAAMLVSVSDNGIGISPKRLPLLFENAQIQSLNGTANEKGTGLGLLLCRKFVEKHRGYIWAESEFGQGSVFKFTLPNPQ